MNRVIRESFDQIRADENLIEGTKQRLKEQRRLLEQGDLEKEESISFGSVKKKKQRMPVFGMAAVGAACLVIGVLLGSVFRIGNVGIEQSPVAYVSIDVNPSIELCLNEKDKVICADAWNDDGKGILDCIDLKGESCLDAVEHLLNCQEFQPYLTDDCELNLTVIGATDAHGKELEQMLKNCSAFQKHNGTTVLADMDIYQEAHDHDMSFGKYLLYQQLHELDHSVTAEDCHDMTIKQMKDQICAHDSTHDTSHDSTHNTTDATHHVEQTPHTEQHENETHDTGTHETEHHDEMQSVPQTQTPQQEVHHVEEEHHQENVQVAPAPQVSVQQDCDTTVTTPSCPEPPCETPVVTEAPCPDSSDAGGHDSTHESGEHHRDGHH